MRMSTTARHSPANPSVSRTSSALSASRSLRSLMASVYLRKTPYSATGSTPSLNSRSRTAPGTSSTRRTWKARSASRKCPPSNAEPDGPMNSLLPFAWRFIEGMGVTLELTALSFAMAFVLGTALTVMAVGPLAPLRWFAAVYVEIMRMTPLLALLLLFVFGLPKLGFMYSLVTSSVLVLGFYTAAWIAEVLRAGVNAVPAGQVEAARSIGMRFDQVLSNVVI